MSIPLNGPHIAFELPELRTIDDLRYALSRYGFPGDRERFEEDLAEALGAASVSDFEQVAHVMVTYRHRVLIRNSPEVMAALEAARPPGQVR